MPAINNTAASRYAIAERLGDQASEDDVTRMIGLLLAAGHENTDEVGEEEWGDLSTRAARGGTLDAKAIELREAIKAVKRHRLPVAGAISEALSAIIAHRECLSELANDKTLSPHRAELRRGESRQALLNAIEQGL